MIRISSTDYMKMIKLIDREIQQGAPIIFKQDKSNLVVSFLDRTGKEITLLISDVDFPFMPTITKTETF